MSKNLNMIQNQKEPLK